MRRDLDRHDRITASPRTFLTLAGEADLGSVLEPLGELEVDRLAVDERDPLGLQRDGIVEGDLQPIGDVRAFVRRSRALAKAAKGTASAAPRRAPGTEKPFEKVAQVGRIGAAEIDVIEPPPPGCGPAPAE